MGVTPAATMCSGSGDEQEPDGAVVVVNYRTPELVERCLESVRATAGGLALETVVLDNDSQDGSAGRLRVSCPQARVVQLPVNGGFAAGVNAGFAHTSAPLVIVLNPDTEMRPGALQALVAQLRDHPRTGVAAPLIEDADGQLAPNGYRRFPGLLMVGLDLCVPAGYALVHAPALHPYAMSPAALRAGRTPAWVSGAAMAIRRSAYEEAGPLDEGFFLYFEETEWQQRVAAHGWAIELVPAACAAHLMRGGGEDSLVHSPYWVRSALRYLHRRGVPTALTRAVLALSLAFSWATLELIALLPSKRAHATGQARAYRELLGVALTARG
jgi:N-acetylglucosaminyl-diphospho-decaprenol L-rhamnosyltransferase